MAKSLNENTMMNEYSKTQAVVGGSRGKKSLGGREK